MSKLIGLGGYLRAGKDAVGDYLEAKHDFHKMGMSDPLHKATMILNPWFKLDYPIRVGYLRTANWEPVRYRDIIDSVGYVEAKKHSEIRTWLQLLGTEVGRKMISESVWIDIAEKNIRALLDSGKSVVLTATRFPNEIDMIHRLGGEAVWIDRSASKRLEQAEVGKDTYGRVKKPEEAAEGLSGHDSENSVSADDFDLTIENNGTLAELYGLVDAIVGRLEDAKEPTDTAWPAYDR